MATGGTQPYPGLRVSYSKWAMLRAVTRCINYCCCKM